MLKVKWKIHLILIILAVPAIFSANNSDTYVNKYCSEELCEDNDHTMCLYPLPGEGENCSKDAKDGTLDFYERAAADLAFNRQLKWDTELAIIAQRWAEQCMFTLDYCRNVERFKVRQRASYIDVYTPEGYDPDELLPVEKLIVYPIYENWANEDKDIWKNENRIGCGKIITKYKGKEVLLTVCNFGYEG